jgi:hypothetical protein
MEFLGLAAYFIPTIIAGIRQHPSRRGIFLLNLLLGWTGIFWIVALIQSLGGISRKVRIVERVSGITAADRHRPA